MDTDRVLFHALLWSAPVEAAFGRPLRAEPYALSEFGKIINNDIRKINQIHPNVKMEKYVIMPNHIHMILVLDQPEEMCNPTESTLQKNVGSDGQKAAPTLRIPKHVIVIIIPRCMPLTPQQQS